MKNENIYKKVRLSFVLFWLALATALFLTTKQMNTTNLATQQYIAHLVQYYCRGTILFAIVLYFIQPNILETASQKMLAMALITWGLIGIFLPLPFHSGSFDYFTLNIIYIVCSFLFAFLVLLSNTPKNE